MSGTGSTRTAPAPDARLSDLRGRCCELPGLAERLQAAYSNLADQELDVVINLGDYIYEHDPASVYPDREHNPPEVLGLDQLRTSTDYRNRQAQERPGDPARSRPLSLGAHMGRPRSREQLRHVHRRDQRHRRMSAVAARFRASAANSYQAYDEHMPIRPRPGRIRRRRSWFSDLSVDPDDPESKTVAVEFAATPSPRTSRSISTA